MSDTTIRITVANAAALPAAASVIGAKAQTLDDSEVFVSLVIDGVAVWIDHLDPLALED